MRRSAVLAVLAATVLGTAVAAATPSGAATTTFRDVPRSQQFYGDITWLANSAITGGYPDGGFHPGAAVSRQAMAAFLYAVANPGKSAPACTSAPFPDVARTARFCPQISWASTHRVAGGYSDGQFHPAAPVSRQAMASFMYALRHSGASAPACTTSPFPRDVPAQSPFCGAIAWLVSSGIADGFDGTHFHPADPVSRQAMAAFLHRLADPAPTTVSAHYLRTTDTATVTAAGTADAAADAKVSGTPLHLLDIGAQTVTAPLSKAHPGVLLSSTSTRIDYDQLVSLVQAYVDGYTAAGGSRATVAVGTNTDGDWTAYPAATRAADWWTHVIAPLRASTPAGIDVIGADDVEAGFAATAAQAAQWKAAFLSAGSSVSGTRLLFNGSADACPTTFGATGRTCLLDSAAATKNWTQAQLGALAGGANTVALPQMYYAHQAVQWANIAHTGGVSITFAGSLTEHAASPDTATPSRGWIALWNALTAAGTAPALSSSVDLDVID